MSEITNRIGNLRVIIEPDGPSWYAQSLELDYATQGETIEDAKNNFEMGLSATFDLNIKRKGHIRDTFLHSPPRDLWPMMIQNQFKKESKICEGIAPFEGIDFYIFETERDMC